MAAGIGFVRRLACGAAVLIVASVVAGCGSSGDAGDGDDAAVPSTDELLAALITEEDLQQFSGAWQQEVAPQLVSEDLEVFGPDYFCADPVPAPEWAVAVSQVTVTTEDPQREGLEPIFVASVTIEEMALAAEPETAAEEFDAYTEDLLTCLTAGREEPGWFQLVEEFDPPAVGDERFGLRYQWEPEGSTNQPIFGRFVVVRDGPVLAQLVIRQRVDGVDDAILAEGDYDAIVTAAVAELP